MVADGSMEIQHWILLLLTRARSPTRLNIFIVATHYTTPPSLFSSSSSFLSFCLLSVSLLSFLYFMFTLSSVFAEQGIYLRFHTLRVTILPYFTKKLLSTPLWVPTLSMSHLLFATMVVFSFSKMWLSFLCPTHVTCAVLVLNRPSQAQLRHDLWHDPLRKTNHCFCSV